MKKIKAVIFFVASAIVLLRPSCASAPADEPITTGSTFEDREEVILLPEISADITVQEYSNQYEP